MKRHWQALSPRAQVVTVVLAGTSLITLALLGAVRPLQDWRESLASEQDALRRELQTVQSLAGELQELRNRSVRAAGSESERVSLSALVEQSLQGRNFQPSRMQVNESGQMQLRLEGVVIDDALSWLKELESYPGVLATAVSVSAENGGRVSLGLTLQQL